MARSTLELVGQPIAQLQESDLNNVDSTTRKGGPIVQELILGQESTPMGKTGPVPVELLNDSFEAVIVPWSIQIAEIKENIVRERLVLVTALLVSWTVTATAFLRLLRII